MHFQILGRRIKYKKTYFFISHQSWWTSVSLKLPFDLSKLAIIALTIVSSISGLFRFVSGMFLSRGCHKSITCYMLLPDTVAAHSRKTIGDKAVKNK